MQNAWGSTEEMGEPGTENLLHKSVMVSGFDAQKQTGSAFPIRKLSEELEKKKPGRRKLRHGLDPFVFKAERFSELLYFAIHSSCPQTFGKGQVCLASVGGTSQRQQH